MSDPARQMEERDDWSGTAFPNARERPAPEAPSVLRHTGFLHPDAVFPNWRSVEIFGPPGAGKSYYCRRVRATSDILTTCDNDVVRYFVDQAMWRITARTRDALGPRIMKNYYHRRKRISALRFRISAEGDVLRYLEALKEALDATLNKAQMVVFRLIVETAVFTARAYEAEQRVLVDEGLGTRLTHAMLRLGGVGISKQRQALVRRCLELYPWDKNAIFIDASPQTCIRRQIARNHVISGAHKPQDALNDVALMLMDMCHDADWRVACLDNEADEADPRSPSGVETPSSIGPQ